MLFTHIAENLEFLLSRMLSTCERIFLHKVLQAMFTKRIEQDIRIAFRTIFQPTQNFHLFPNKTFIFSPIWPQSFHKYHS